MRTSEFFSKRYSAIFTNKALMNTNLCSQSQWISYKRWFTSLINIKIIPLLQNSSWIEKAQLSFYTHEWERALRRRHSFESNLNRNDYSFRVFQLQLVTRRLSKLHSIVDDKCKATLRLNVPKLKWSTLFKNFNWSRTEASAEIQTNL